MNNKEKQIFIFTIIGAIAIVAIVFFTLVFPSVAILKRASERSEERRTFVEGVDKYNSNLADLKQGLLDNDQNIKIIREKLLSNDDIIRIIVLLENLAEQVDINQEISISRQAEDKVVLKNSVSGEFNSIMQYVDGMDNLKYIVTIEEITFSSFKDKSESKCEIIINVPIYY